MTQEQIDLLPEISFSYNWNQKLQCYAFTTLRIFQPEKYKQNQKYRIKLKGKIICIAEIAEIRSFYLHEMNEFVARLDTGYSLKMTQDLIRKMYPKVDFKFKKLSLILLCKMPETELLNSDKETLKEHNPWIAEREPSL